MSFRRRFRGEKLSELLQKVAYPTVAAIAGGALGGASAARSSSFTPTWAAAFQRVAPRARSLRQRGPGRERKVVTVLFADLVGFTARADALDPEDVEAPSGCETSP